MSGTTSNLLLTLRKLQSDDNDILYMSLRDLNHELKGIHVQLDQNLQTKLIKALERILLLQSTNDVHEILLNTLPSLIHLSASIIPIQHLVDSIIKRAIWIQPKEGTAEAAELHEEDKAYALSLRTRANNALVTIIADCTRHEFILPLASKVLPICLKLIHEHTHDDLLVSELLNLLATVVKKQASILHPIHSQLLDSLLHLLHNKSRLIVSQSVQALAALAPHLDDTLYKVLLDYITNIEQFSSPSQRDTNEYASLLAIAAVSKTTSQRVQRRASEIIDLLCNVAANAAKQDSIELRESSLVAVDEVLTISRVESILAEMNPLLSVIEDALNYNPNVIEDDEHPHNAATNQTMKQSEPVGDENDEFGSVDEEFAEYVDGYDDDDGMDNLAEDDTSWRIRRNAIKCLSAILQSCTVALERTTEALANTDDEESVIVRVDRYTHYRKQELIKSLIPLLLPLAMNRVSENVESVRSEVMKVITTILQLAQRVGISAAVINKFVTTKLPVTLANLSVNVKSNNTNLQMAILSAELLVVWVEKFAINSIYTTHAIVKAVQDNVASCASHDLQMRLLQLLDALLESGTTHDHTMQHANEIIASLLRIISQSGNTTAATVTSQASQAASLALNVIRRLLLSSILHASSTGSGNAMNQPALAITNLDVLAGIELPRSTASASPVPIHLPSSLASSLLHTLITLLSATQADRKVKSDAFHTISYIRPESEANGNDVKQLFSLVQSALAVEGLRLAATSVFSRLLRSTTPVEESALTEIVMKLLAFTNHSDRALQRATLSSLNNIALRNIEKRMDTSMTKHLVSAFDTISSRLSASNEFMEEVDVLLHETLLTNIIIAAYRQNQPIAALSTFLNSYITSKCHARSTHLTINRTFTLTALFSAVGSYSKEFQQPYNEFIEALRSSAQHLKPVSGKLAGYMLSTYSGVVSLKSADVFNDWRNYEINEHASDAAKQLLTPYVNQLIEKQLPPNDVAFYYTALANVAGLIKHTPLNEELSNTLHRIWQLYFTTNKRQGFDMEIARSYAMVVANRPTTLLPPLIELLNTQMGLHALLGVTEQISVAYVGSEPQQNLKSPHRLSSLVPALQKHTADIVKAIAVYQPPVDEEVQANVYAFLIAHFPIIIFTYFSDVNPIFVKGIQSGIKYVNNAATDDTKQAYQQFFTSLQEFLPKLLVSMNSDDLQIEIQKSILELIQYIATTTPSLLTAELTTSIYSILLQRQTQHQSENVAPANGSTQHATPTTLTSIEVTTLTAVINSDAFVLSLSKRSADVPSIVNHVLEVIIHNTHNESRAVFHELFNALCSTLPLDSTNAEKLTTLFSIIYDDIHSKANTTLNHPLNSNDIQQSGIRTAHFIVSNKHLFPALTVSTSQFEQLATDGHVKSLQHHTVPQRW